MCGSGTGCTIQDWFMSLDGGAWLWHSYLKMNPNTERILDKLREKKPDLLSRYPIQRIGLFGSRVRDDFSPNSDVDILVDVDPGIGLRFVALADEIEQLLGLKVDLVSRRAIKPSRLESIQSELVDV